VSAKKIPAKLLPHKFGNVSSEDHDLLIFGRVRASLKHGMVGLSPRNDIDLALPDKVLRRVGSQCQGEVSAANVPLGVQLSTDVASQEILESLQACPSDFNIYISIVH
jgi:hypothetical protein